MMVVVVVYMWSCSQWWVYLQYCIQSYMLELLLRCHTFGGVKSHQIFNWAYLMFGRFFHTAHFLILVPVLLVKTNFRISGYKK